MTTPRAHHNHHGSPAPSAPATRRWFPPGGILPGALTLALVGGAVVTLALMGRVWWCACAAPSPWTADIWSSHCSQHLFDAYTFSHISHGLLFYVALHALHGVLPDRWKAGFSPAWWFAVALALEAGWEVLENTPMVIERYRAVTVSLSYNGDSILNSLSDIAACAAGFWFAHRFGVRAALLLFLAFEAFTLVWIRDNLTLNVFMLVAPFDAVRHWQTPPHLQASLQSAHDFLNGAFPWTLGRS